MEKVMIFRPKNNQFWCQKLPPLEPKPESDEERKAVFFFYCAYWLCWFLLACAGDPGFYRLLLDSTGDAGDDGDTGYIFRCSPVVSGCWFCQILLASVVDDAFCW